MASSGLAPPLPTPALQYPEAPTTPTALDQVTTDSLSSLSPQSSTDSTSTPPSSSSPTTSASASQAQHQNTCYLCSEQNPNDFSPSTKNLNTCLLCSRPFCAVHKSTDGVEQVCNINHSSHYRGMLDQAQRELGTTAAQRELDAALVEQGIHPSVGERELSIFSMVPVDDSTKQQLEEYRSQHPAEDGYGSIEVRDFVGADIGA